jgi:hypothetical protein
MCIFSGPVESVSTTKIFARSHRGWQALVYSMKLSAARELAMVLPLPTPPGVAEDGVRFVNLEDYPDFFGDMASGFDSGSGDELDLGAPFGAAPTLEVHQVGSFVASFVPTRADFARLDRRFRVDDALWERLYADWSFAVFQFAPGREQDVHPMALVFPQRAPGSIHFPTVHVHQGKFERSAWFDHTLYFQTEDDQPLFLGDRDPDISAAPAQDFLKIGCARKLVAGEKRCFRHEVVGTRPNVDLALGVA